MSAISPRPTAHIFTIDVEEHFQVSAFEGYVPRADWDGLPSRVEGNVHTLLELLARHGATATFFTLGWVASRKPHLARAIVDAGHEIASHGWWHRRVSELSPAEFREEVRTSRATLEDATGKRVRGFRAPSFSIGASANWAFDVLLEEGYEYDSSVFPIRRPGYGSPGAPRLPYIVQRPAGELIEFPLATTRWRGIQVPAAGGGYLRHFPLGIVRRALREHGEIGIPAVLYVHPWEIDPDQPRMAVPWLTRVRHYGGLTRTLSRLGELLGSHTFVSFQQHLAGWRASKSPAHPAA